MCVFSAVTLFYFTFATTTLVNTLQCALQLYSYLGVVPYKCLLAIIATQHSSFRYYKWKNHFYKMKGDVGMSGHEKERKQEDAYTKIQTHS